MQRYLFFVSKIYSFDILRPIQKTIFETNSEVYWYIYDEKLRDKLNLNEKQLETIQEVIEFNPEAIFTPGNWVPDFFPGIKVQVFHGFGIEKKGHFRIRNHFDLYCTHGPLTTKPFNELAKKHPHFKVIETGWPKVDPLFETKKHMGVKNTILYAPTFSPAFSSCVELFPIIKKIVSQKDWQWLIKFHPKQDLETIDLFKSLENKSFKVIDSKTNILPLMQDSSVLLTDTSSVISEFMLLDKPVITFKGTHNSKSIHNVENPESLTEALTNAIKSPQKIVDQQEKYISEMHPYRDGLSSQRVLKAVDFFSQNLSSQCKPKPLNLFRRLKIRWNMKYFRF